MSVAVNFGASASSTSTMTAHACSDFPAGDRIVHFGMIDWTVAVPAPNAARYPGLGNKRQAPSALSTLI